MPILIACEESQRVCTEFRKRGVEAYSCDLFATSGEHPEWHIICDVLTLLHPHPTKGVNFFTQDFKEHHVNRWTAILAFPPCTDLCASGARHFDKKRADGTQRNSIIFFCEFLRADCDFLLIENPVGIISGSYVKYHYPDLCYEYGLPIKPTQVIQPYWFGDRHRKTTCLWLRGFPELKPTNFVDPTLRTYVCKNGKVVTFDEYMVCVGKDRAKHRSKTFPGIAKAIAEQYAPIILEWEGKYCVV